MAALRWFLVTLVLLHAAFASSAKGGDLDIVGTDAIKDIIRYFNNRYPGKVPSPAVPNIIRLKNKLGPDGQSWYSIEATEGKMSYKGVKLATPEVHFNLTLTKEKTPAGIATVHVLSSTVPITVEDLVIRYGNVDIDIHIVDMLTLDTPRTLSNAPKTTNTGAAKISIGKNKFLLQTELYHIYVQDRAECVFTVSEITAKEFEVKDIHIFGITDPTLLAAMEALASTLTTSLQKDPTTYAPQLVKTIIEQSAETFFRNCFYVDPKMLDVTKVIGLSNRHTKH